MKKIKGLVMIEFALTAFLFFMIVFGIFEFGLVMDKKNGNNAGLFYATRYSTTQRDNFNNIKDLIIDKHQQFSFSSITRDDITIVRYRRFNHRINEQRPRNLGQNRGSRIYVFTVNAPYNFITNFFRSGNSTLNVTSIKTVYNEAF